MAFPGKRGTPGTVIVDSPSDGLSGIHTHLRISSGEGNTMKPEITPKDPRFVPQRGDL